MRTKNYLHSNRQYDNTMNIFEGILRNWLFPTISAIMVGGQILIAFVGGRAFSTVPLTGAQWAVSLVLGLFSLPVGVLIRLIPDAPLERMYRSVVQGLVKFRWRRNSS